MKTILIVEDEIDIATVVEMVLNIEGYQAYVAENGKQAIELLEKIPKPDLVISDLMMPVLDGYDFINSFKASPVYRDVPVIVVSAGPFDETRLPPGSWSFFIRKPFSLESLYSQVSGLIGKPSDSADASLIIEQTLTAKQV
jgi:two-component system cell cycle sensor histidine kinase/response regulator CckA